MKITLHNYEEYIIDYLENKINQEQKSSFEAFLQKHPHIQQQINEYWPALEAPVVVYANKEQLYWKESITNSELNDQLIGLLENQLDEQSTHKMNRLIQTDATIAEAFALYKKTILTPDYKIRFPKKDKLYRQTKISTSIFWSMAMAASLALLIFLTLNPKNENTNKQMSVLNWAIEKPKIVPATINLKNTELATNKLLEQKYATIKVNENIKTLENVEIENTEGLRTSDIALLSSKENFLQQEIDEKKITMSEISYAAIFKTPKIEPLYEKSAGWTLAENALDKIHRLTKKGIVLDNEYTSDGQIARLVIVSENFKYEREFTVE